MDREPVVVGVAEEVEDKPAAARRHLPDEAEIQSVNETLSYVRALLPSGMVAADVEGDKKGEQQIRYSEADKQGTAAYTPDDTLFSRQYAPDMVNAPDAWEYTTGTDDVLIAVLDTGVKYDHEDLAPNMDDSVSNHGRDFVSLVDSNETRDDDPYPDDITNNDGDDIIEAHGTHVAGILGAKTDNGTGVAGICDPNIICGRVLDDDGAGWYTDFADGIQWATDQGADIINLSLGSPSPGSVLEDAVSYARNNGALPIAAAGNDGSETDFYPAAYPEVIAVSALNESGDLASYSNYGDYIELTAPGSGVLSAYPTDSNTGEPADEYAKFSGTSIAAPVVSGVAGLVLSYDDSLSPDALADVLKSTAVDVGLPDKKQGAGRVDAQQALEQEISVSLDISAQTASPGSSVEISPSGVGIDNIAISEIWTDWEAVSPESDDGSFTDNIAETGQADFSWSNVRRDTTPSVTLDFPDRYVGGTYGLTVTASNHSETVTRNVSITIE